MRKFLAMCLGMMLLGIITPSLAYAQAGAYKVEFPQGCACGFPA